ncbi:MAG: hypothetical protein LLG14_16575 [Nocardiaceae bacterium]|nr:hypothetical protein [Nocardiaceae bacterium]
MKSTVGVSMVGPEYGAQERVERLRVASERAERVRQVDELKAAGARLGMCVEQADAANDRGRHDFGMTDELSGTFVVHVSDGHPLLNDVRGPVVWRRGTRAHRVYAGSFE